MSYIIILIKIATYYSQNYAGILGLSLTVASTLTYYHQKTIHLYYE